MPSISIKSNESIIRFKDEQHALKQSDKIYFITPEHDELKSIKEIPFSKNTLISSKELEEIFEENQFT